MFSERYKMTLIRTLTRACVREYVSLIMKEPEDVVIGGKRIQRGQWGVTVYCTWLPAMAAQWNMLTAPDFTFKGD